MPIKFGRFAVTVLLLGSSIIAITALMMSSPQGEAQYNPTLTPTRYAATVTIYRTVHETFAATVIQLRTVVQLRTVRTTIQETIYGTARTSRIKCSNVTIAWTVSVSNFGLPSSTSYSVTGWNNTGLVASSPGLGPQSPSAWPLLGAGAVAGAAITAASMLLGQRMRRPKIK
ncbi:MAG TPA: hypothetical protein VLV18_02550 [Terriglobales bacterium]|nr:hypothetical protein [Terriglobales bacterium]